LPSRNRSCRYNWITGQTKRNGEVIATARRQDSQHDIFAKRRVYEPLKCSIAAHRQEQLALVGDSLPHV
jgi:alpha-D-ribose 1-methylphosphonate 5-triphosphate synthase subunit PhnG